MPTWIFDRIGWFASEYFIDCVDFEYCLRIRAAGYLIADSREAVLMHAAGHANQSLSFLGVSFRPTHHSAVRRYYMSRNRIALYRKYFRVFPGWVLQSMNESLRETVKCFLGEQDRARKFRSFLLGAWDGLTGRMGKRDIGSETC
jgi:rhamnosyltransferase